MAYVRLGVCRALCHSSGREWRATSSVRASAYKSLPIRRLPPPHPKLNDNDNDNDEQHNEQRQCPSVPRELGLQGKQTGLRALEEPVAYPEEYRPQRPQTFRRPHRTLCSMEGNSQAAYSIFRGKHTCPCSVASHPDSISFAGSG